MLEGASQSGARRRRSEGLPSVFSGSRPGELLTHYLNEAGASPRLTAQGLREIATTVQQGSRSFRRLTLGSAPGTENLAQDLSAILEGRLDAREVFEVDGRGGARVPEIRELQRWRKALLSPPTAHSGETGELGEEILDLPVRQERLLHYLEKFSALARAQEGTPEREATVRLLVDLRRLRLAVEVAVRELVEANLLLVVPVARRYRDAGLDLIDLVQEGNIGLIKAARRFEPDRGFLFSTYATWWIRQVIQRAILNRARLVRLPIHREELLRKVRTEVQRLAAQLENPTPRLVARRLQAPLPLVRELMMDPMTSISFDSPVAAEGELTLGDLISDPRTVPPDQLCGMVLIEEQSAQILGRLGQRERHILQRRFGLQGEEASTFQEISRDLGISAVRVRQIEAGAMRKLRSLNGLSAAARGALDRAGPG